MGNSDNQTFITGGSTYNFGALIVNESGIYIVNLLTNEILFYTWNSEYTAVSLNSDNYVTLIDPKETIYSLAYGKNPNTNTNTLFISTISNVYNISKKLFSCNCNPGLIYQTNNNVSYLYYGIKDPDTIGQYNLNTSTSNSNYYNLNYSTNSLTVNGNNLYIGYNDDGDSYVVLYDLTTNSISTVFVKITLKSTKIIDLAISSKYLYIASSSVSSDYTYYNVGVYNSKNGSTINETYVSFYPSIISGMTIYLDNLYLSYYSSSKTYVGQYELYTPSPTYDFTA